MFFVSGCLRKTDTTTESFMKAKYHLQLLFVFLLSFVTVLGQTDFNKLDATGKKDGQWKGFYKESKRLRYEGLFSHGKEVGLFKFYDDTNAGSLIATREFDSIDNSAYTIFYDQEKNKVSEGKLVNKVYEGIWKYYHKASSVIMTLENYQNGKLEGLRSVYYPNGKIAEEVSYSNNLKNGSYKKYAENGIVLEESSFKNNEYNGPSVFRDADGNVVSKGNFTNGKKTGKWLFFEKGKLVNEVNMSNPKEVNRVKKQ